MNQPVRARNALPQRLPHTYPDKALDVASAEVCTQGLERLRQLDADRKKGLVPMDEQLPREGFPASRARIIDYLRGGKDHYAADRHIGDLIASNPDVDADQRIARDFMRQAALNAVLVGGIDQFLMIDAGYSCCPDLHEIVGTQVPDPRIVYAESDLVALMHGQALLTGPRIAWVSGKLTDPKTVLNDQDTRRILDLRAPVAVVLISATEYIPNDDAIVEAIRTLFAPLPVGSWLIMCQAAAYSPTPALNMGSGITFVPRTHAEIAALIDVDGLRVLDPGIVPTNQWWPDPSITSPLLAGVGARGGYAAVARKHR